MTGLLRGALIPLALLVAAEIAFRISGLRSDAVAAPSAVLAALANALADGSLLLATAQTLFAAFAGLLLGGSIGLGLGLLFGLLRQVDRLMEVTVEAVRPIPSVALIPIALLALGFGARMEIVIVAFSCIWPVLILTRAAVAGIEPQLAEVARVLRLSPGQRIATIVLPAALPRLVVAFRLALGIALVVAVTVEIAADPQGLGNAIMVSQQALQPALMLATLVWIGLVGVALNGLTSLAQRRFLGRAAALEAPR